jgi:hypothetical protein
VYEFQKLVLMLETRSCLTTAARTEAHWRPHLWKVCQEVPVFVLPREVVHEVSLRQGQGRLLRIGYRGLRLPALQRELALLLFAFQRPFRIILGQFDQPAVAWD